MRSQTEHPRHLIDVGDEPTQAAQGGFDGPKETRNTLGEACDDRIRNLEGKMKALSVEDDADQVGKGRRKKKKRLGQVYCCMKFSRRWKTPVHAVLNKLKKKHGLGWLRISMSYSKHSNFRES